MIILSNPLVSVVMCTYNGEKYLAEQLNSILEQTYPNIEVVIIDDCSTDNTLSIIRQYEALHSNIKIFVNQQNLGYVKNFEKGMMLATGSYIALSDQDDIWEKEKITVLVDEIEDYEIVYCNSLIIDEAGNSLNKKLFDKKRLPHFDNCLNFTIGNTPPGHAMLITKELTQRCFPFPDMIPHDRWLGFVAACKHPVKFVDMTMVKYRRHPQNVFGAVKTAGTKRIKKKSDKKEKLEQIRERMHLQYLKCPEQLVLQKKVLLDLDVSYTSFSLKNNFNRMMLFFWNRNEILAYKQKSNFRKWLFCLKMFYKIK
jgi:glycosyltransferase involved in cell wall biosynthesis